MNKKELARFELGDDYTIWVEQRGPGAVHPLLTVSPAPRSADDAQEQIQELNDQITKMMDDRRAIILSMDTVSDCNAALKQENRRLHIRVRELENDHMARDKRQLPPIQLAD